MSTTTPFAINLGSAIQGTTQIGNIAIGASAQDYSSRPGGVTWYMGPDEDLGYIIAYQNGSDPTFWRSAEKTDASLLLTINSLPARSGQTTFTDINTATDWLTANGYYYSATVAVGQYTIATDSWVTIGIYKASDDNPKTLLRSLTAPEYKTAGTYTIYWDGLDDNGTNIISTNDYEGQVVTNNFDVSWGTIGNSSALDHGEGVYRSYTPIQTMAISGDNVYFGDAYNEAGARKGFKADKGVNIQTNINILPAAVDPDGTNSNDTNVELSYVCTNGTNTYWVGQDPGPVLYTSAYWAYATSVVDDTNVGLTGGTLIKAGYGATYPNAFAIKTNDTGEAPTGMCCNDNFVWIGRGDKNRIDIYSATNGLFLSSTTGVTGARELQIDTAQNKIYMLISNVPKQYSFNVSTGALTPGTLTISDFPANIKTIGIDNVAHTLGAIVGGTGSTGEQRVWAWNITSESPSGTSIWKLGQTGGNAITPIVDNDTFSFDYPVTGSGKCYLAFDSSSNIYVGDVGNCRTQIFNSSRVYQDSIFYLPALYSISINMTDSSEVAAYWLIFDVATGVLKRNYGAYIAANYAASEKYDCFKWWATLSNGKTYATVPVLGEYYWPAIYIFEMSETGLRNTGVNLNPTDFFTGFLDKDFSAYRVSPNGAFAVGTTVTIKKKVVSSFSSNNPVYGTETDLVTLAPIVTGDVFTYDGFTVLSGITDSGILSLNNNSLPRFGGGDINYYLQGNLISTGAKVWSQFRPTTDAENPPFKGYIGQFPDPRYYDIGNSTRNTMQGTFVLDDITYLLYRGEFWANSQTNYANLYYKNGLPLIQFGTNRIIAQALETAAPYSAGNALSYRMIKSGDTYYLLGGDESVHSAIQKWTISNASSIAVQTITLITPPNYASIEGTYLMDEVVFNSILSNTSNITISNTGVTGFSAQSGNVSYDSNYPEIYLVLAADSRRGVTEWSRINITPSYNPVLTYYKVYGEITFKGNLENENNFTPYSLLRVLDDSGKVISQISFAKSGGTFQVLGNSTEILSSSSDYVLVSELHFWQNFSIVTSSSGSIITYANYSPVTSTIVDPTANWNKPTTVELTVNDSVNQFHYGDRCIGGRGIGYVDYTTPVIPVVSTAGTTGSPGATSSTQIQVTFDTTMSVTTAGWSASKGTNLNISGITGSGSVWTFTVDPMISTDTITISYNPTTGNTLSGSGVELSTVTSRLVTNSISAPSTGSAVVLQRKYITGGVSPLVGTFDSAVSTGSLIHIQYMGSIGAFGISATSNNSNSVQAGPAINVAYQSSMGNFFIYNANAGSTTITCSGIANAGTMVITEYSGIKASSNPMLDQGSAQGTASPLQASLTYGAKSLLIVNWFNKNVNDYTSLVGPVTLVTNGRSGFDPFVIAQNLSAAAGTNNLGVNTGGDVDNLMIAMAFEIA